MAPGGKPVRLQPDVAGCGKRSPVTPMRMEADSLFEPDVGRGAGQNGTVLSPILYVDMDFTEPPGSGP